MPFYRPAVDFINARFTAIHENRKFIAQFLLAALFIFLGVWFVKHEQAELGEVKDVLLSSRWKYILLGIILTGVYIVLQGVMYQMAFASVKNRVKLSTTMLLFLKRNFISVFMPAGGVASLAFFTGEVEKQGVTKTRIHFASSIYAFTGILSVVLAAVPVFVFAIIKGLTGSGEWISLAVIVAMVFFLFSVYHSIIHKKLIYRLIVKLLPSSEVFFEDISNRSLDVKYLVYTVLISILVDVTGVVHLLIAMKALGYQASLFYALLGYLTAVLSLIVSPFMRGLGAVEVSLSFILIRLGYSNVEGVAIAFLYRFFEFWVPLLAGAFSFLVRINRLLMRVFPALLIFALGVLNIISVLTPAIQERLLRLEQFVPIEVISASNYFVLLAGILMLLSAIYMLKGLRNAWWIGLALSAFSVLGHLFKAIDYEEAGIALLVFMMLLFSRREYRIKGNPRLHFIGIQSAMLAVVTVLIYGTIGFYFLDEKHFGINFSALQSVRYTIRNFLLLGSSDLVPHSRFAKDFLLSINLSGAVSVSFLFYTMIRPYIFKGEAYPEGLARARQLINSYGRSGMDYFKTYNDKLFFLPEGIDAFISYRVAGNFAVALEDPVAADEQTLEQCIGQFDKYCYDNGLKSIFYRVPEESLRYYERYLKKNLFLGQEGIVKLESFTLQGERNKALRNAINKISDRGYSSTVHLPPVKDGLMQKLKAVSDEWLRANQRHEIVFSQGMFVWEELKQQTILTVENEEEKVIAFVNIIPDYAPGEGTYDLIRKTDDAPNGVLDFLLTELFRYLKSQGCSTVNLGFAPLSGINDPNTFPEKSMRFAYEKIKAFSHYKGLRNFKEKFSPEWRNKYLVYSNDYDLLQIPAVLTKVIKVAD
ncbi:MAG TPA: phosphatidylglycerol lysyltransferase domain-containing protein [Bacteroidales bacterium]|nr:phosphatidylglycerol lysyltransferase domain-containing protein [Bacteroidales bacterium]HPT03135.1 phosphatidylglycerol lysyltransferase domain-containing protein [Bacteroidales bacterium]